MGQGGGHRGRGDRHRTPAGPAQAPQQPHHRGAGRLAAVGGEHHQGGDGGEPVVHRGAGQHQAQRGEPVGGAGGRVHQGHRDQRGDERGHRQRPDAQRARTPRRGVRRWRRRRRRRRCRARTGRRARCGPGPGRRRRWRPVRRRRRPPARPAGSAAPTRWCTRRPRRRRGCRRSVPRRRYRTTCAQLSPAAPRPTPHSREPSRTAQSAATRSGTGSRRGGTGPDGGARGTGRGLGGRHGRSAFGSGRCCGRRRGPARVAAEASPRSPRRVVRIRRRRGRSGLRKGCFRLPLRVSAGLSPDFPRGALSCVCRCTAVAGRGPGTARPARRRASYLKKAMPSSGRSLRSLAHSLGSTTFFRCADMYGRSGTSGVAFSPTHIRSLLT